MSKKRKQEEVNEKLEDWDVLLEEMRVEGDRACALLGGAFMEEMLSRLLRTFLVKDNPVVNDLFTYGHALDGFSNKIEIAHALGILTSEEYTSLNTVRTVRNDFAHSLHGLSFDSPHISERVRRLKFMMLNPEPEYHRSVKEHFRMAILLLVGEFLRRELAIKSGQMGRTPWPIENTLLADMLSVEIGRPVSG